MKIDYHYNPLALLTQIRRRFLVTLLRIKMITIITIAADSEIYAPKSAPAIIEI
jgi:hypothetical protein